MAKVRTNARSFAGGEIASELFGRIDHVKYSTGLAKCRNFLPLPHGPVVNRAGTRFVSKAVFSDRVCRLIPFTFSTTQTMVLEIGEGYARFHTNGATLLAPGTAWSNATAYTSGDSVRYGGVDYYCTVPNTNVVPTNPAYWLPMSAHYYELPLPYSASEVFDIRYVQSNDVLTLCHANHPPAEIRRLGAVKWVYGAIAFGASTAAPSVITAAATPAATSPGPPSTQSYVVTAIGADGTESIASPPALGLTKNITSVNWVSGQVNITDVTGNWSTGDFAKVTGSAHDGTYVVDTIDDQGGGVIRLTLRTLQGGLALLTAGASGGQVTQLGVRNNLYDDGAYNTLRWAPVAGAQRYYVYKSSNGLYGLIGQTDQTIFRDDNIAANISQTPPTNSTPFGSIYNYPAAATYFEQRRVFGGTVNKSQTLWFTKPGTESNLNQSIPTRDDDAISFRIASRQSQSIQHFIPVQALVILTDSAVWRVTSVNTDALTPTSISVKAQSNVGANNVQPVLASENAVYVAARGGHLREISYSWQQTGYVSADLSRYNPVLFDNLTITDMAYAESPYPVIWAVSSAGYLISVTYVPQEEVSGLARHDTDGVFESVACVAEGLEDAVYVVVRRVINGATVRYIERMASRHIDSQANSYFVDAGVTYSGVPIDQITGGLSHLEGKTVNILGDGAVMPQQIVTAGALPQNLPIECGTIHVGLPIEADLQTLPVVLEVDGLGQGRAKNVNKVWLKVDNASGIFAGPDFSNLTQYKQRTSEPYGVAPALTSGEIEIVLDPAWSDGGQVCVRQSDPLPMTIVSLTAEVSIGG